MTATGVTVNVMWRWRTGNSIISEQTAFRQRLKRRLVSDLKSLLINLRNRLTPTWKVFRTFLTVTIITLGLEIWPETPILPKLLFSWRRLPM